MQVFSFHSIGLNCWNERQEILRLTHWIRMHAYLRKGPLGCTLNFIWGSWWCVFLKAGSGCRRSQAALVASHLLCLMIVTRIDSMLGWGCLSVRKEDLFPVHSLFSSTAPFHSPHISTIRKLSWKLKLTFQLWNVWPIFVVSTDLPFFHVKCSSFKTTCIHSSC